MSTKSILERAPLIAGLTENTFGHYSHVAFFVIKSSFNFGKEVIILPDNEMTYKKVEEIILSFFDKIVLPDERAEKLKDLIHRLNFELRLTLLTDEEWEHMMCELSSVQRETLNKEKPDSKAYEDLIQMYARTMYFRKIEWANYLSGHTDEKPFSSPKKM